MRNLVSVNISLLCAVSCVMSAVITKRGTEGGHSSIQCPYDRGFETNQKYLSKGIWAYRVDVIKTQTHQHPAWTHEGRFSLFDDTERRVFTVTITNLILEDSGTYWCEINTWWWYNKTEFRLTVDRAPVPPNPGSVTSIPLLSTTHPSTNIPMTTDSSNSTAVRTNGTVGTTSPPTDMTRTQGDVMFSGVGLGVLGDVMFSGVGLGVLGDVMFSGVGLGVLGDVMFSGVVLGVLGDVMFSGVVWVF
ncbi:CMRF35-like molecule 5 isoform X4 [Salvelinus alpinus]|uniref:CMRF35-like molecule 5 isoform X4 n=1 Tax=Salvelinus alpinus TaxID=8036 RepID=UPI0039FD2964